MILVAIAVINESSKYCSWYCYSLSMVEKDVKVSGEIPIKIQSSPLEDFSSESCVFLVKFNCFL
jgi:hypothetical protein